MSKAWKTVRLGEVLRRSEEVATVDALTEYREITVRLWGKGVVERGRVSGANLNGRRFIARQDQFIASRIDARNGAMGIVPQALDGALVTNDFPLFDVIPERLLVRFLGWLCQTRGFVDLCLRASEGTTNRVRLKEEEFLALEIPLPPLSEQRRIVARIEELAAEIETAQRLRAEAVEEAEAVVAAARCAIFGTAPQRDWVPLRHFVASIENGKSPRCESRPATEEEWGVLKVGAVSFGAFDDRENKALPAGYPYCVRHEVRIGDFLMTRANTTELVGACAVVKAARPRLLLSDKVFRLHFRPNASLIPQWLDHAMKSAALRSQIEQGASGTSSTMKNISKEKVLELLLPQHEPSVQREAACELDMLHAAANELRSAQADSAEALDALMPSLLDRAFKGEL